jgi:hypothetical protein
MYIEKFIKIGQKILRLIGYKYKGPKILKLNEWQLNNLRNQLKK